MTRFCGREQEKGKAPTAQTIMNLSTAGIHDIAGRVAELGSKIPWPEKPA